MSTLAHRRLLILRIVICLFACTLLSGQEPAASPGTLLQHAIALHKAGDLEGAIRAYREYLAAEPDSVQARSNLGAALAGTGRYDEAIAEYAYALQQSPDNPATPKLPPASSGPSRSHLSSRNKLLSCSPPVTTT
jgi:tetratricopeptide (TPR) repeat protein